MNFRCWRCWGRFREEQSYCQRRQNRSNQDCREGQEKKWKTCRFDFSHSSKGKETGKERREKGGQYSRFSVMFWCPYKYILGSLDSNLVWIYVLCLIWIFVKPKIVEVVLKIYLHCEGCAKDVKRCIRKMPGLLQTYNILILDLHFLIGENLFPIASWMELFV